tara:strand:- start:92 stop:448 length:357 start_codon:yes stop_codon:yes gene_type:complete
MGITMQVINKPWGKEEVVEINDRYMVKKLTMWAGQRCSLQYHEIKHETIYVLSGKLKITKGDNEENLEDKIYSPHEYISLEPGVIHRMEAIEDATYLEASTPEMDDVVRLQDDYIRSE